VLLEHLSILEDRWVLYHREDLVDLLLLEYLVNQLNPEDLEVPHYLAVLEFLFLQLDP
jgi:hypothetical protein